MRRLAIVMMALFLTTGCAGYKLFDTGAQSGVADKSTGDSLTASEFDAVNTTANTADALATVNETAISTITALTGPVFSDGDGTYTDMSAVSSTELGLLDGETDLASQSELDTAAALVDTDDEIIAIINASPSTQIKHEAGGLEADVSAYTGVPAITGGATYELNTLGELETAVGAGAYFSDIAAATDAKNARDIIKTPVAEWEVDYDDGDDDLYNLNDLVENDGVIYKCIVEHDPTAAREPGTGVDWTTYWGAGGTGFDKENPGEIGGTTPATMINADEINMTRGETTGDSNDYREGSNNGDNYTTLKGKNNQSQTATVILPNHDGLLGPPVVDSAKTTDHNAYANDGEWNVIPFSGSGTKIYLDDITNLNAGVIRILSLDANDKYIQPALTDQIWWKDNDMSGTPPTYAWVTTMDAGDKLTITDIGWIDLYRKPDQTGWYAFSDVQLADGGAGAAGWNPGLLTDADCVGYYLFESGALETDSSTAGAWDLTAGNTPVADAVNYIEGAASVDMEQSDSDYFTVHADSTDVFGWATSGLISITGWFKAESTDATRSLFKKDTSGNTAIVIAMASNNRLLLRVDGNDDTTYEDYYYGSAVTDDQWYFFAITIDNGNDLYSMYVWDETAGDTLGSPVSSASLSEGIANLNAANATTIGTGSTFTFDGNLDEWTFWDVLISSTTRDQIRAGTYGQ